MKKTKEKFRLKVPLALILVLSLTFLAYFLFREKKKDQKTMLKNPKSERVQVFFPNRIQRKISLNSKAQKTKKRPGPESLEELKEAFEKNNFCYFLKEKNLNKFQLKDYIKILSRESDLLKTSRENEDSLDSFLRKFSSNKNTDFSGGDTEAILFFNALYHGNLWEGIENPSPDREKAIDLLEGLAEKDPRNALYPLYLAYLRDEQGEDNREEVIGHLLKAFSSGKYINHHSLMMKLLTNRSLQKESSLLAFNFALLPQLPSPVIPWEVLSKYIRSEGKSFAEKALRFSELLQKSGKKEGEKFSSSLVWNLPDFSLSMMIKEELSEKYGHEIDPGGYDELLQIYMEKVEKNLDKIYGYFTGEIKDCPKDEVEEFFKEERGQFIKSK